MSLYCTCSAPHRTDRVFNAALALLIHRNGPSALLDPNPEELARCTAIAAALNVHVERYLGATQPDPFKEEV